LKNIGNLQRRRFYEGADLNRGSHRVDIPGMDGNASAKIRFDTAALAERDRFPMFCEEVARRYTGLDLRTQDQRGFRAAIELRRVGAIDIGRVATSPVNSVRTTSLLRDGDDGLLVTLLDCGRASHTQRDSDQTIAAGEGLISDCGYPGELNIDAESQFWHLKIPRYKFAQLFNQPIRFAGARLDKDIAARRLLLGYVREAFNLDVQASARAAELYEQHIVDLIALALGAGGEVRATAEDRGVRSARLAAILKQIAYSSNDPALSAVTIAQRLGVTPRYVHSLLEETGRSFTHHVLERRLEQAAAVLRDTRRQSCKIASIAGEVGFNDLSHFNRAFRRRFGVTPSDIRNAAASAIPDRGAASVDSATDSA
jgi:AraC-like DNA-binding protein